MKGRTKNGIYLKLELLQHRKINRGDSDNIQNQIQNIKLIHPSIYKLWMSNKNTQNIYKES